MLNVRLSALALAGVSVLFAHYSPAASFLEDFSTNPTARGWQVFGDTNLFYWDGTNQNLRVTWDSSQANSYFYHPLGTILTRRDDFSLAFDVRVDDAGIGTDSTLSGSFPLAVALLNLNQATQTTFYRGTGFDSPNLVEWDYYWDAGYGATVWPLMVDSASDFNWNAASDYALYALAPGAWYRVVMAYTATNQTLTTTLTNLADGSGLVITDPASPSLGDFQVATLAISSYSEAGQDPAWGGSVLGHGAVDNFNLRMPPPPVQDFKGGFNGGLWQTQFTSRTNWNYALEGTQDFKTWTAVSPLTAGTGSTVVLQDTNTPAAGARFYRVRALPAD